MRVHKIVKLRNAKDGMDAKKILSKLDRGNKVSFTISIDKNLLTKVQDKVGGGKGKGKVSQLIEELLKEFLESLEKDKK